MRLPANILNTKSQHQSQKHQAYCTNQLNGKNCLAKSQCQALIRTVRVLCTVAYTHTWLNESTCSVFSVKFLLFEDSYMSFFFRVSFVFGFEQARMREGGRFLAFLNNEEVEGRLFNITGFSCASYP